MIVGIVPGFGLQRGEDTAGSHSVASLHKIRSPRQEILLIVRPNGIEPAAPLRGGCG